MIRNHLNYLVFIISHKWYVFLECCKLGIAWRGVKHDMGKMRPKAFREYSRRFAAGNDYASLDDVNYLKVFAAHLRRSDHHWQYWCYPRNSGGLRYLPMADNARKEFLADLRGSSRYYKTDVKDWYKQNRMEIHLHAQTRDWLEERLEMKSLEDDVCSNCEGTGHYALRFIIPELLCPACQGTGQSTRAGWEVWEDNHA